MAQQYVHDVPMSGEGFGYVEPATVISNQTSSLKGAVDWRDAILNQNRSLWIRRDASGEEVRALYWTPQTGYLQDGYCKLCNILRDVQADRVFTMDLNLLDVLFGIQGWLAYYGYKIPIDVTSGFRTARTNGKTEGAALNSRHLSGQASDIYFTGIPSNTVGIMATMFQRGGVGFYPQHGFTHVDVGSVRQWLSIDKPRFAKAK
jgi:uncharacterized protein YcbK (DUF882 family)